MKGLRHSDESAKTLPRVRLKAEHLKWTRSVLWLIVGLQVVAANRPPRFLIDGRSEIVIRLKEGPDTPVGKFEDLCSLQRVPTHHKNPYTLPALVI